jgi:hypothetical protein
MIEYNILYQIKQKRNKIMWGILIGIGVVVALIMYLMCIHAATGYQDEEGFHYGKEKEVKDDPVEKS